MQHKARALVAVEPYAAWELMCKDCATTQALMVADPNLRRARKVVPTRIHSYGYYLACALPNEADAQ